MAKANRAVKATARTVKATTTMSMTTAAAADEATGAPATAGEEAKMEAPPPDGAPSPRPATKLARVETLLGEPGGATLAALAAATGWQPHTLQAALTRLRQAGRTVKRTRNAAGETVYVVASAREESAEAGSATAESAS